MCVESFRKILKKNTFYNINGSGQKYLQKNAEKSPVIVEETIYLAHRC